MNVRTWLVVLVVVAVLIGRAAAAPVVQAQGTFAHGTVVALRGTPHLWVADRQGVLHWAGDTRALADKYVRWGRESRVEVTLEQLRRLTRGDPWLSAGLLKDGDPIYLVKWENDWAEPRLLHIQSIGDVELFGINGGNYGSFVLDRPTWEARFGRSVAGLQRSALAVVTMPRVLPTLAPLSGRPLAGAEDRARSGARWKRPWRGASRPARGCRQPGSCPGAAATPGAAGGECPFDAR